MSLRSFATLFLLTGTLVGALSACKSTPNGPGTTVVDTTSSYTLVQSKIFTQSCVECHNTPTAGINGHLDLSGDSAYARLVNANSWTAAAASFGLGLRVSPGHPDSSFLYKKLRGPLEESLGERMPKGGHALSDGKIEFVRQWIAAGAPRTGAVADASLLLDNTFTAQAPLAALPAPSQGFQLHLMPFDIQPGSEREVFVYKANPMQDTQYMHGLQISMREGSHHFILWNVDGSAQNLVEGQLRDRTDNEMARPRDFTMGAQTLTLNFEFPKGIAVALPPNMGFDFNSHYVNPSSEVYHGEAYINVNTVNKSTVEHLATPFLVADQTFNIPPHSTYMRAHYWPSFTSVSHLLVISSHAHKHMVSFKIFKNGPNGKLLYSNTDWQEPTIEQMDEIFAAGEQLYSETTWQNDGDRSLHFGFTSEDEMSVILGYYWQ